MSRDAFSGEMRSSLEKEGYRSSGRGVDRKLVDAVIDLYFEESPIKLQNHSVSGSNVYSYSSLHGFSHDMQGLIDAVGGVESQVFIDTLVLRLEKIGKERMEFYDGSYGDVLVSALVQGLSSRADAPLMVDYSTTRTASIVAGHLQGAFEDPLEVHYILSESLSLSYSSVGDSALYTVLDVQGPVYHGGMHARQSSFFFDRARDYRRQKIGADAEDCFFFIRDVEAVSPLYPNDGPFRSTSYPPEDERFTKKIFLLRDEAHVTMLLGKEFYENANKLFVPASAVKETDVPDRYVDPVEITLGIPIDGWREVRPE